MRWNRVIGAALLLAAVVVIAGCTTTTTTTTTTPTTTTQTGPCSRATISGDVLKNYMPATQSGWTAGTYSYGNFPTGLGCNYATVNRTDTSGNQNMAINIWDTNYWTGMSWYSIWGDAFSDANGYGKSVTVNGYPGWERACFRGWGAQINIQVIVDIGNGIWVWVMLDHTTDVPTIYSYVNAINYAGLDALA